MRRPLIFPTPHARVFLNRRREVRAESHLCPLRLYVPMMTQSTLAIALTHVSLGTAYALAITLTLAIQLGSFKAMRRAA